MQTREPLPAEHHILGVNRTAAGGCPLVPFDIRPQFERQLEVVRRKLPGLSEITKDRPVRELAVEARCKLSESDIGPVGRRCGSSGVVYVGVEAPCISSDESSKCPTPSCGVGGVLRETQETAAVLEPRRGSLVAAAATNGECHGARESGCTGSSKGTTPAEPLHCKPLPIGRVRHFAPSKPLQTVRFYLRYAIDSVRISDLIPEPSTHCQESGCEARESSTFAVSAPGTGAGPRENDAGGCNFQGGLTATAAPPSTT